MHFYDVIPLGQVDIDCMKSDVIVQVTNYLFPLPEEIDIKGLGGACCFFRYF